MSRPIAALALLAGLAALPARAEHARITLDVEASGAKTTAFLGYQNDDANADTSPHPQIRPSA